MFEAMPEACSDFSVFSPPFPSLFSYTSKAEDIGNSENLRGEAKLHLGWFYSGLRRVLKPGRACIVHVMQIPRLKRSGEVGLFDLVIIDEASQSDIVLNEPSLVYQFIGPELQALGHESVRVILLTTRLTLLRTDEVFRGSLNECTATPRDLLRKALIHNAYAFILIHNHPSGDPTPSDADRRITRRLREAADATGLLLQDHVIIGTPAESRPLPYFSFKEHGML
jgi:DNA repair protein RadC